MSELLKRVFVAVLGIPLIVGIIYLGGIYFALAIILISSLCLYEFYGLFKQKSVFPMVFTGIAANVIILAKTYYMLSQQSVVNGGVAFDLLLVFFVMIAMTLEMFSNKGNALMNISSTVAGVCYLTFSLGTLMVLREISGFNWLVSIFPNNCSIIGNFKALFGENGNDKSVWLVLALFISVWLCDITAYFIGKQFGKHKLFPRVSPKKSWEGAVAGFFGSILGFALTVYLLIPTFPLVHSIIIGAIIGVTGQIGDLAESHIKRDALIKDSSSLLPGHGGFLDRFDSIIFSAPAVLLYIFILLLW